MTGGTGRNGRPYGVPRAPEMEALQVAEQMFGPYRMVELLGRGGMGEVWRALDTRKDRTVALKVLGTWVGTEQYTRRFRQEAALVARLNVPNIIPIHDYGEIEGRLFIDMPLVDGVDLEDLVVEVGPLPGERAVSIIDQIADALDAAHRAGLVHRDVKPSNVLLTQTRAGHDFAYLIDFGIARAVDGAPSTASGSMVGTPAYMAPERFTTGGDRRSDIYALACVAYQMLTGSLPFVAPAGAHPWGYFVDAHLNTPPPRVSDTGAPCLAAVDEVVRRGMAKDPAARPGSAGEFAATLRSAMSGDAGTPAPGTALTHLPARSSERDRPTGRRSTVVPDEPDTERTEGPRDPRLGRAAASSARPRRRLVTASTLVVGGLIAGVLLVGRSVPASPPERMPAAPAVPTTDWRNATYTLTCDGLAETGFSDTNGFTTTLRDGFATAASTGGMVGTFAVKLRVAAYGDVTGDGRPETVVLLSCSPEDANYFVDEVQVFRPDNTLLAELPSPKTLQGDASVAPEYVPTELRVEDGRIVAGMMFYEVGAPHSRGATDPHTLIWRWTGSLFEKTADKD